MSIDFSAFAPNTSFELADAFSSAANQAPEQEAALQAVGQQLLLPYKQAALANPALRSNPHFIAQTTALSKRYHLILPMMGGGGGSFDAIAPGAQQVGAVNATPASVAPQQHGGTARFVDTNALKDPSQSAMAFGVPKPPVASVPNPTQGLPGAPQQAASAPAGAAPSSGSATPPQDQQSFMAPSNQGPLRIDFNAWTGRQISMADFSTLSGMQPDTRKEALIQQGYELHDFDQKWLNSPPSLSPDQQIRATHELGTTLAGMIAKGDSIGNIKTVLDIQGLGLTPDQRRLVESDLNDQMNDVNRARFQQIQNTNLFHQATITRWNREDTDREQNTTWDHNYKYEVLHDRDAQWGAADSERQQRLNLDLDRYHLDQDKFANQRQEQQFRQTNVSTPQLFTLAQKLLQQIQSEANEANRRIDWATKNKKATPGGGISDPMIQSYQNNVDAYNQVVQELSARGGSMGHIYKPWQGPDINATNAYAAGSTAQQATAAQGQPATSPVAGMQQVGVDSRNNKPVYKSASGGYFYQDGTPVPK